VFGTSSQFPEAKDGGRNALDNEPSDDHVEGVTEDHYGEVEGGIEHGAVLFLDLEAEEEDQEHVGEQMAEVPVSELGGEVPINLASIHHWRIAESHRLILQRKSILQAIAYGVQGHNYH